MPEECGNQSITLLSSQGQGDQTFETVDLKRQLSKMFYQIWSLVLRKLDSNKSVVGTYCPPQKRISCTVESTFNKT
jgi:hypothetical protein